MFSTCGRLRWFQRFFLRAAAATEGAEIVEAAFVLPVVLMFFLGLFWMGRGYMIYETITRAAREGARYEVLPTCGTCGNATLDPPSSTCLGTTSSIFQNYVAPALRATNLDPGQVTNYCQKTQWLNTGDDPQACGVVISFTYPAAMAIPLTSLNAATINISTQVQMRNENQPASIAGAAPTCP